MRIIPTIKHIFFADDSDSSTQRRTRRRKSRRRNRQTYSPDSTYSYSTDLDASTIDVIESVGREIDTNIEDQSAQKFENQVRSVVKKVIKPEYVQESCDDEEDVTVSTTVNGDTKMTEEDMFAKADKKYQDRCEYLHKQLCKRFGYTPGIQDTLKPGDELYNVYWGRFNALRSADPFFTNRY